MIKLMKKIIIIICGILTSLIYPKPVAAQTINFCASDSSFGVLCKPTFDKIGPIIGTLLTIILIFAIVIALFFLIYGGIKWVLSGGDKTAVEAARNHIIAAIVGLVIALLSFFILNFVLGLFGLTLTNITFPKIF